MSLLAQSGHPRRGDRISCHVRAFGGKADIMMKRLYVRYDQSGHSKLLEGATTSSWLSIGAHRGRPILQRFFSVANVEHCKRRRSLKDAP
jgi:hypothetical protein